MSDPDMDFTDTITENTLRAIRFDRPAPLKVRIAGAPVRLGDSLLTGPEHIPVVFWVNPVCWHHYRLYVLFGLMAEHSILFPPSGVLRTDFSPEYEPPELAPWERAGEPYTDAWSCVWETTALVKRL